MKVYFHGGPKNGLFEEIPDGRDSWDVYIPPVIEMTFKEKEVLAQPITPRIVTYVPSGDWRLMVQLGLFLSDVSVFVPRNTVDANGMPANHRWN